MSKTIKELANELGISKQAVSKKLTANFRANHVTTVTTNGRQRLVIDDDGVSSLKSKQIEDHNHQPTANQSTANQSTANQSTANQSTANVILVNELKKRISAQEDELSQKNKQIFAKDTQLENMQKLLDQAQQLQLMDEKKIAALEAPKETETPSQPAKSETTSETVTEDIKKEPRSQKKGFWHRIFK